MNSFDGIPQTVLARVIRREECFPRAVFAVLMLFFCLEFAGCSKLAKVKDTSVPRLVTPLASADLNQLVTQLKPFAEVQSLRASRVALRFIEPQAEQRWRDAEAIVVMQRPDRIRLVIQAPVVKTRIAEMVSEANHFKVAIHVERPSFLMGTNDADYSSWREKLGKDKQSSLANARPFHFTDSMLMRPLRIGESGFTYSLEEQLLEDTLTAPDGKPTTRVLRSYYVVTELASGHAGQAKVLRRFWFDRTDNLQLKRQQLFGERGELVTEVSYSNYQKMGEATLPSVVLVSRPHDGFGARFTFTPESFELNPELPASAFVLENKENLPVTDLDKPQS